MLKDLKYVKDAEGTYIVVKNDIPMFAQDNSGYTNNEFYFGYDEIKVILKYWGFNSWNDLAKEYNYALTDAIVDENRLENVITYFFDA
jgi:hypothetical protein